MQENCCDFTLKDFDQNDVIEISLIDETEVFE